MTSPNFPATNVVEVIADLRRRLEVLERTPRARSRPEFHSDAMGNSDFVDISAVSPDWHGYAALSVPVPVWARSADVVALAGATFVNGNSSNSVFAGWSRIDVGGDVGAESFGTVQATESNYLGAAHLRELNVSALSTFDIVAEGRRSNASFESAPDATISGGHLAVIVVWGDE